MSETQLQHHTGYAGERKPNTEMRPRISAGYPVLFLAVIFLRVWLVHSQPLSAASDSSLDDQLYLRNAVSILNGHWLGPYDSRIFSKGPGYPLWIAGSYLAEMPLLLGQHLFYLLACLLVLRALRPAVSQKYVQFSLFLLLWFIPSMYATPMLRVMRDSVYTSTSLIMAACGIAVILWRYRSLLSVAGWLTVLGLSSAFFYITREEGIWMGPSLTLLFSWLAFDIVRSGETNRFRRLLLLPIAPLLCVLGIGSIVLLNNACYHFRGIVELKTGAFPKAYGALTRVVPEHWQPDVPVPREVRHRLYGLSPAFAELESYLEGGYGRNWASFGWPEEVPPEQRDIKGGWFLWALRFAAEEKGHHASAARAEAYYTQLAREINHACSNGVIPCGPRHESLTPPWRWDYAPLWLRSFAEAVKMLLCYEEVSLAEACSEGYDGWLIRFERTALTPIAPPTSGHQLTMPNRITTQVLQPVIAFYRGFGPVLAALGTLAFWGAVALCITRRRVPPLMPACIIIGIAVLCRLAILSFISISSFPALTVLYMAPAYPLVVLFMILAITAFFQMRYPAPSINRAAGKGDIPLFLKVSRPKESSPYAASFFILAGLSVLCLFCFLRISYAVLASCAVFYVCRPLLQAPSENHPGNRFYFFRALFPVMMGLVVLWAGLWAAGGLENPSVQGGRRNVRSLASDIVITTPPHLEGNKIQISGIVLSMGPVEKLVAIIEGKVVAECPSLEGNPGMLDFDFSFDLFLENQPYKDVTLKALSKSGLVIAEQHVTGLP